MFYYCGGPCNNEAWLYVFLHMKRNGNATQQHNSFRFLTGGVTCMYIFTYGGRDGLWWPALSEHWLYRMLAVFTWLEIINYGILFPHLSSCLGFFHPQTFFTNTGLDKSPWTSCKSDLQTKLRITSRNISGLATDSPRSVWGHGWTTDLKYGGSFLGLCFFMTVVV